MLFTLEHLHRLIHRLFAAVRIADLFQHLRETELLLNVPDGQLLGIGKLAFGVRCVFLFQIESRQRYVGLGQITEL